MKSTRECRDNRKHSVYKVKSTNLGTSLPEPFTCKRKHSRRSEAVDMNGIFQMQGGKNWFLPKEMNANRFFWDSHWLEIWSNNFYPSMGLNGGSVATDSDAANLSCAMINRFSLISRWQ
jgi:hypothetical protein